MQEADTNSNAGQGSDSKVAAATAAGCKGAICGRDAAVITVGGGSNDGTSLQDAFTKFRKERARTLKLQRETKARQRSSPKHKAALRAKFLERVRSYIGVPYAQKYHEPGTEDYDAPLFLDCCGLVRKAMDDLQEEFGFRIGRWNQAYMYDVLDKDVAFEDLKPGDLIFYEATYSRPNAKPQKHNMVHVEVFIGGETGEATIGARWQKGHCQVHPSYKFASKNYHDVKHYYKSLEPWLEGRCESHCEEHKWEVKGFTATDNSKSVFYADEDEAAEPQGMEVDDGEEGDCKEEEAKAAAGAATAQETKADTESKDEEVAEGKYDDGKAAE